MTEHTGVDSPNWPVFGCVLNLNLHGDVEMTHVRTAHCSFSPIGLSEPFDGAGKMPCREADFIFVMLAVDINCP
jgi:hypothetical protein